MSKVLIVVDMQNDFIYGIFGTDEAKAIIPKVNELIESGEYDKIIFTKDTHFYRKWSVKTIESEVLSKHCEYETKGWYIVDDINTDTADYIIDKPTFTAKDLNHYMGDERDELEITLCGVCTDICVISNALKLRADYTGSIIKVVADACAGTTPENHEAALKVMKSCLIEVI